MKKISLLLVSWSAFSAYGACELNTPDDVLSRVKKAHPQIVLNELQGNVLAKDVVSASLSPNIELDADSSYGDSEGETSIDSSVTLKKSFELGGKRDARVQVARERLKESQFGLTQENESAISDTVLKLYSLRQTIELVPLYKETLAAFGQILSGLKKYRTLSPEQQVEKETLELALNSYRLKVSQLNSEKMRLEKELGLILGDSCKLTLKNLPSGVVGKLSTQKSDSSQIKMAKQSVKVASSMLSHENSLAVPDLQFGPKFGYTKGDESKSYSVGLAFTMELPFSNRNQGGRAKALEQVRLAAKKLEYLQREQNMSIDTWISRYERYRNSLNTIATKSALDKKHKRIEKLFKRGVISTSLVIESHRQLIDYTNTRFEYELGAVEALWNIYRLQGNTLTAKIGGNRES